DLRLDLTEKPEFDHWRWVDFWYPVENVVTFKRGVYASALRHLAPFARQVAGPQAIPVRKFDPPRRHGGRRKRPHRDRGAAGGPGPGRPGRGPGAGRGREPENG